MEHPTRCFCVFLIVLNTTINVLASPGNDWFEEQKRRIEKEHENFGKGIDERWKEQKGRLEEEHDNLAKGIDEKWDNMEKQWEKSTVDMENQYNKFKEAGDYSVATAMWPIFVAVGITILLCCCCGVGLCVIFKKRKGRVIRQNTPMTNQGTTGISTTQGQSSYNPVPTQQTVTVTQGYGNYPAPPGMTAQATDLHSIPQAAGYIPQTTQQPTSSYPAAPSQSQYPTPPTPSAYNPQPVPGSQSQYPLPSSGDSYSKPQDPYNPSFTGSSTSGYNPPPAYSGNIANTPVIQ